MCYHVAMDTDMVCDEEALAVHERRCALVDEVADLAAHLHAADARLIELLAEADQIGAWDGWKSMPQWLSATGGFTIPEAQKRCRLKALPVAEPEVFERMGAGRFSVGVADTINHTINDTCRREVLDVVDTLAPAQIATALGKFKQLRPPPPKPDLPPAPSSHQTWEFGDDGRRIDITLHGISGALYSRALDAAREHLTRNPDSDEHQHGCAADRDAERSHRHVSDLEAFEHMLSMTISNAVRDDLAEWAGDDLRLQINIDLDDLINQNRIGRYLNGRTITGIEFDEALCGATLQTYFHRSQIPLNYGREHRLANRIQRRALLQRDRGCTYPGCHARKHLVAHHIIEWECGGLTDINNLVLLCTHHHRLVHRLHIQIELGANGTSWYFSDPDGTPIGDPTRKPQPVTSIETHHQQHRRRGLDPCRARARYYGEPLTPYALDVLLQHLLDAPSG